MRFKLHESTNCEFTLENNRTTINMEMISKNFSISMVFDTNERKSAKVMMMVEMEWVLVMNDGSIT